jgi:hypothetical protein
MIARRSESIGCLASASSKVLAPRCPDLMARMASRPKRLRQRRVNGFRSSAVESLGLVRAPGPEIARGPSFFA